MNSARYARHTAALVFLATLATGTACTRDRGPDPSAHPTPDVDARPPSTAEVEPAARRPAELEPHLQALLWRYDTVTGWIMSDPAIARDRGHPLYDELLQLLTPGSALAERVVGALVEQGDQGLARVPYDFTAPPVRRTVAGEVTAASTTEVAFPVCAEPRYRLWDAAGREVQRSTGPSLLARARARRVEGRWRLDGLDDRQDLESCIDEIAPGTR